jgi:hypothetical protein
MYSKCAQKSVDKEDSPRGKAISFPVITCKHTFRLQQKRKSRVLIFIVVGMSDTAVVKINCCLKDTMVTPCHCGNNSAHSFEFDSFCRKLSRRYLIIVPEGVQF